MNEILRDHERVSVRLVLTPEKLGRRGAAHLHLPVALRVPDRRGRRQPRAARRGRRLFRRLARAAGGADGGGRDELRSGARAPGAVLRRGGRRDRDARAAGRRAVRRGRSRRGAARPDHTGAHRRRRWRRAADRSAVRPQGRDRGVEGRARLVVRVGGHKRTLALPPASATIVRPARPSRTARCA